MSLRDPTHQAAIELRLRDTEYVEALKDERDALRSELSELRRIKPNHRTLGTVSRIEVINQRLARIEELLAK